MPVLAIESNKVPFLVRFVFKGDAYGTDHALRYDKEEPAVEFYDARFKDDKRFFPLGQLVSRYYLDALLEPANQVESGLDLQGGVPEWKIDGATMATVCNWLREEFRRKG